MFTTCLFCHTSLGTNPLVEHFPVGRRLAFDAEKGRLWVVCTKCGQWNLSPLEERWEAIEECERFFRDTRLRVSTDNIGLARLAEGLTLVRIGRPQRPEMAAWRYGDQFGRRRKRYMLYAGGGALAVGAIAIGGAAAGIAIGSISPLINAGVQGLHAYRLRGRIVARVPLADREPLALTLEDVRRTKLIEGPGPIGWALEVTHRAPFEAQRTLTWAGRRPRRGPTTTLTGAEATAAARLILPKLNASGAGSGTVRDAVRLLEEAGGTDLCFADAARLDAQHRTRVHIAFGLSGLDRSRSDPDALMNYPVAARLALEMAAHEEIERRALEGELALLEDAWREAEEIAAIADNMFLPENVKEFIEKHRRKEL